MPRSGAEVRRRLQVAALTLYSRQGYDATTAAEIASEAGVTERTFFRHFPDKREVLFDDGAALSAAVAQGVAEAPETAAPLAAIKHAFHSVVPIVEGIRPFVAPRFKIIAETPALRERELAKLASMQDAAAEALVARGVPDRRAKLAAGVSMAALDQAMQQWQSDPESVLDSLLDEAFDDLSGLVLQAADGVEEHGRSGDQSADGPE